MLANPILVTGAANQRCGLPNVVVGDQDVSSHLTFSVRQLPEQSAKDLSPHEQRSARVSCRQFRSQVPAYLSGREPATRIAPLP